MRKFSILILSFIALFGCDKKEEPAVLTEPIPIMQLSDVSIELDDIIIKGTSDTPYGCNVIAGGVIDIYTTKDLSKYIHITPMLKSEYGLITGWQKTVKDSSEITTLENNWSYFTDISNNIYAEYSSKDYMLFAKGEYVDLDEALEMLAKLVIE